MRSTPRRSRTCCAPGFCPRRTSPRASCAICASCCPTARHLCAWAGLVPTVRSSDGKARLGHISRQGSPALRWALTEAAQKIPTGGGPLRATFERIAKRRGRKIAKVAVARQTLTLCYYGLRDGEIRCLKHQPDINHHDELAEAA